MKQELTKNEVEQLVALQSNKYKKDVGLILDTYYMVLKEAILTGYKIKVPDIGSFSNTQVKPKGERKGMDPNTLEPIVLPAHDGYIKPVFKFNPTLKNKMKEDTKGGVF